MIISENLMKLCRCVLLISTAACFPAALAVIGASIYLYIDKSDLLTYIFELELAEPACIIILTVGCAMLLLSLFGALAASLQNKWILSVYGALALLVALLAFVAAIIAISAKSRYFDYLRERMRVTLQTKYGVNMTYYPENRFITEQWDRAQEKWYCCGTDDNSWGVYRSSIWYDNQPGSKEYDRPMVPKTCCMKNQYGVYIDVQKCQIWADGPPRQQSSRMLNEALIYKGCYTQGKELIEMVSVAIIIMGFLSMALLGFCAVLTAGLILGLLGLEAKKADIRQKAYEVRKMASQPKNEDYSKQSYYYNESFT